MPISKVDSFSRLFDAIQRIWLRHYFSHLPSFILLNSAHKPQKQTKPSKYSEWLILSKQYSALCLIKNLIDISQHRKMEAHTASEIQSNISTCDKHTRPASVWELWAITMLALIKSINFSHCVSVRFIKTFLLRNRTSFTCLHKWGWLRMNIAELFECIKSKLCCIFFIHTQHFRSWIWCGRLLFQIFFRAGIFLTIWSFHVAIFSVVCFFLLSSAPNGSVLGSKQTTVEKQ